MICRRVGLFSSKDVEIGKMLLSYVDPLSITPAYHLKKIRTCQSVPVYRRVEGPGTALAAELSVLRGGLVVIINDSFSFRSITLPNARSPPPPEPQYPFGQQSRPCDEGEGGHRNLNLGIYGWASSAGFHISEASINAKALAERLSDDIGSYCGHEGAS